MNLRLSLLVVSIAFSCAKPPAPAVFGDVAAVRARSGMDETRRLAPQTVAEAERLTRLAEQAHSDGEPALAQFAAERALAAYARADVEARLGRTEEGLRAALADQARLETDRATLTRRQTEAARELSELDLRLGIERDLDVTMDIGQASPEREAARAKAARFTATEARLLCASARLLGADRSKVALLDASLDQLEESLTEATSPAPLPEATQLRADCLTILGETRRPSLLAHPADPASDRLLAALAEAGFGPRFEDRGIVISVPVTRGKSGMSPATRDRLKLLAKMAQAHEVGLLVVSFAGAGTRPARSEALLAEAKRLFGEEGVTRLEGEALAESARWTPREAKQARETTEELEIVFVTRH